VAESPHVWTPPSLSSARESTSSSHHVDVKAARTAAVLTAEVYVEGSASARAREDTDDDMLVFTKGRPLSGHLAPGTARADADPQGWRGMFSSDLDSRFPGPLSNVPRRLGGEAEANQVPAVTTDAQGTLNVAESTRIAKGMFDAQGMFADLGKTGGEEDRNRQVYSPHTKKVSEQTCSASAAPAAALAGAPPLARVSLCFLEGGVAAPRCREYIEHVDVGNAARSHCRG